MLSHLLTDTETFSNNSSLPVYLTWIGCLGVESRLVECRRGGVNNITNCNTRVGAYCAECMLNNV